MIALLEPIGIRRLRKLQRVMAGITDAEHFSMICWLAHDNEAGPDSIHGKPLDELTLEDLHNCGTTACALGYACVIESFKRAGLKFNTDPHKESYSVPTFEGEYGYDAAAAFFDISPYQAETLFTALGGRANWTPKYWAAFCQNWLDERYPTVPPVQRFLARLGL